MDPITYKFLHLLGLALLMFSLGGLTFDREQASRKPLMMTNGVGLLLMLVAGFGAAHKGGLSMSQPWLIIKVVMWLLIGGWPVILKRKPELGQKLAFLPLALVAVAAYLGVHRGF